VEYVRRRVRLWLRLAFLYHRHVWRRIHTDGHLAALGSHYAHGDGFAGYRVGEGDAFACPERIARCSLPAFVERGIVPASSVSVKWRGCMLRWDLLV
jgi:hypothetical protein